MNKTKLISVEGIYKAKVRLKDVALHTPLMLNQYLSDAYGCNVYLKREDLQVVRSYKIRGAYNKMYTLPKEVLEKGVVCASAGNHAQGVAFACHKLGVACKIYMPTTTPLQKINKVKRFGKEKVEIILVGDTFDASNAEATQYARDNGKTFIHPFDDERVMEGQATVGMEILEDCGDPIDYLFVCIGGGGLAAGVGSYFKQVSPQTQIIGVEPSGAASMKTAIQQGKVVKLEQIERFVDGAAVQQVGQLTYEICKELLKDIVLVPEGKVCTTILNLYNEEAIVVEPAGALTISALDFYKEQIKGKTVVCVVSGGNNDITRMEEIKERSMLYEGLKHYFILSLPQRAGALRDFLHKVLGKTDDITRFEYSKKNNREMGHALIGIEFKHPNDYHALVKKMNEQGMEYQPINDSTMLYDLFMK